MSQECFKGVSRVFQECFKSILRSETMQFRAEKAHKNYAFLSQPLKYLTYNKIYSRFVL